MSVLKPVHYGRSDLIQTDVPIYPQENVTETSARLNS